MKFMMARKRLVEEANARLSLPIPKFALTKRDEVIDRLMKQPDLLILIRERAAQSDLSEEVLLKKARQYAEDIGPKFSPFFYFRFAYFLARAWLRLHFDIRVISIAASAYEGVSPNATVIIVSNHRSNFDPLLITYLASRHSTVSLSAGEWARLWPLHHFVRAAGGFVVDRNASDPLYRYVLASYLQMAVASGLHQAFFPEGELTRDGRVSSPKLGFLNFYCRACSRDRDIVFIPVGINYDRIPEDRRLAHAEGSFENPGVVFLIGSSLRYLAAVLTLPFRRRSRRYGTACVAFGAPISLHEWLARQKVGIDDLKTRDRYNWLPDLASTLMKSCAQQIPALPVAVIAAVMCAEPGTRTWHVAQIKIGVSEFVARMEVEEINVCMPEGIGKATELALELLVHNRLIRREENDAFSLIEPELIVLRYYASSIEHLLS